MSETRTVRGHLREVRFGSETRLGPQHLLELLVSPLGNDQGAAGNAVVIVPLSYHTAFMERLVERHGRLYGGAVGKVVEYDAKWVPRTPEQEEHWEMVEARFP